MFVACLQSFFNDWIPNGFRSKCFFCQLRCNRWLEHSISHDASFIQNALGHALQRERSFVLLVIRTFQGELTFHPFREEFDCFVKFHFIFDDFFCHKNSIFKSKVSIDKGMDTTKISEKKKNRNMKTRFVCFFKTFYQFVSRIGITRKNR